MKERGIICKADEVRQLLGAERSAMTRVIRAEPDYSDAAMSPHWKRLPLGNVGDHLYVRESFTWSAEDELVAGEFAKLCPERAAYRAPYCVYRADGIVAHPEHPEWGLCNWRRAATMPRWASRITLEVVQSIVQSIDGEWVRFATVKRIDKAKA